MTPPIVFAFADPERRTWLALNSAGTYYHWVHPAAADDIRVQGIGAGEPILAAGDLTCECAGGRFRGRCYVVAAAEALPEPVIAGENWFAGPAAETPA